MIQDYPPEVIQQRFIERIGERAYDLCTVLVQLDRRGDRLPRSSDEAYDTWEAWARQQGFLIDGRTVTGLDIDQGEYIPARHLDAVIAYRGSTIEPAALEHELQEQEQFSHGLITTIQSARDEFFATTPEGAALKRIMDDACRSATASPNTHDASPLRPSSRYALRLLVDEHGTPLPATEERTTMLRAVETLDVLAQRADRGDERAAAFVTRLTSYVEKIGKPIALGKPLTPSEQEVYEEFRRDVNHANTYRHLCS